MEQPALGRKISELRKGRGLTQEELVDRCNVSIRTLQRIEAGEVKPRIYTIRTILASLDYDLSEISGKKNNVFDSIIEGAKRLLLIDVDLDQPSDTLIRPLQFAGVFGIIYFILGFFEAAGEFHRMKEDIFMFNVYTYVVIKILVLVSYIYFLRGFILIGVLFKNYLLKIASFILICGMIILLGYDIASVFYDAVEREFILGGASITFGVIGIIFGIALYRLSKSVGRAAEFSGILEIVAGLFFLTIFLFFIGEIILIPAEVLQIIIIFKVIEMIKSKQSEGDSKLV